MSTVGLVVTFVLWYGFNAAYNVYNSNCKNDVALPLAVATTQLLIGMIYAVPLWVLGLRALPRINGEDFARLLPIAIFNAFGHACTVCAMFEKGGSSFTHVIKASEPVVSVILGVIINGAIPKPLTALTLLPISYGVAYASTLGKINLDTMSKDLMTNAALLAMTSNVAFSMRSIMKKKLPKDFQTRTNLDPANEHAISTLLSFVLLAPFVLLYEPLNVLQDGYEKINDKNAFLFNLFVSGISFYLYNEFQNKVLGSLGAVPTAVGNTLKRVVIFVALYFCTVGETFPLPKVIGCAIAIVGCLAFAIFDSMKL